MTNRDWDQYFMTMAYLVATRSKDQSTTVGSVIVSQDNVVKATGYNSFVRGFEDEPHHHERPLKYELIEHSERNAIYNAARVGNSLSGCKIYLPWMPCTDCARAIIQAGIVEVILHAEYPGHTGWSDKQEIALDMFNKCGVVLRHWSGKIDQISGLISGKVFDPSVSN